MLSFSIGWRRRSAQDFFNCFAHFFFFLVRVLGDFFYLVRDFLAVVQASYYVVVVLVCAIWLALLGGEGATCITALALGMGS